MGVALLLGMIVVIGLEPFGKERHNAGHVLRTI